MDPLSETAPDVTDDPRRAAWDRIAREWRRSNERARAWSAESEKPSSGQAGGGGFLGGGGGGGGGGGCVGGGGGGTACVHSRPHRRSDGALVGKT